MFQLSGYKNTLDHFKTVKAQWEKQMGNQMKRVRSDNAGDFLSDDFREYLRREGIIHELTVPYAHQQNGKAERYIRTLEDGAITLMADANVPLSFWGDAVLTKQYLMNLTPTSTLPENMTPSEAFTGNKPDLSHLRVWGCRCFVQIPCELRSKGRVHSYEAIFVGYEPGVKGYRIRDKHGKYHVSRDIIFDENHVNVVPLTVEGDSAVLPSDGATRVLPDHPIPFTPPRNSKRVPTATPLGMAWQAGIKQRI